jgi:hypothetical protein
MPETSRAAGPGISYRASRPIAADPDRATGGGGGGGRGGRGRAVGRDFALRSRSRSRGRTRLVPSGSNVYSDLVPLSRPSPPPRRILPGAGIPELPEEGTVAAARLIRLPLRV